MRRKSDGEKGVDPFHFFLKLIHLGTNGNSTKGHKNENFF